MASHGQKIGRYVKYKRLKDNLSINEFAKRCGLTSSFILRLENGAYKTLKLDVIEKLADGLAMTLDTFLFKCEIVRNTSDTLPSLDYYLREIYQFPDEAVNDVKLFLSLLETKYQKEIKSRRLAHSHYWHSASHSLK